MGFQTFVNTNPAPAVAGDFADTNPRTSVDAGPGGLVAGANGLTVGAFAWWAATPVDVNGTPITVNNSGSGPVTGFVHREQQALITTYLTESGMVIPAGFQVTLMSSGSFWAKNAGAAAVTLGMSAFASTTTGAVSFAAAGATVAGSVQTKYVAMSAGAVGELIKISSHVLG